VAERTHELERRLREREVLLREIHHRVKNNLQVVSSLISIQANRLPTAQRTALDECQARIRTIALVHQRLYQSSDLASVELDLYVRELARNIHAALAAPGVELAIECEPIGLPVDAAIPCGLILNELITNAFKHAFYSERTGTVHVRGERVGGDIRLTVRDDGVGLPAAFSLASTSTLGFQLVEALVDQLAAKFRFGSDPGAWFELVFAGG
jgi:two-component sensor histidine kinase